VDRLPNLESCYDETPLTEVMSKMLATRSQYLAVRDEQGVIFGVLRKADLMIQLAADVERHQAKNRKQLGAGAHSVKKPLRFQMNPDPYESMGSSQKVNPTATCAKL
jgi:CBS domain containing-hemolysin-like protein